MWLNEKTVFEAPRYVWLLVGAVSLVVGGMHVNGAIQGPEENIGLHIFGLIGTLVSATAAGFAAFERAR